MANNVIGINEENLSALINELNNYIEDISKTFNDMDDIIEGTNATFQGEAGDALRNKYDYIKLNFPRILNNLESYTKDLVKIRNNYVSFESSYTLPDFELEGGNEQWEKTD